MRMFTATLMAAGLASVLTVMPAQADETIQHRTEENTEVRTGGAPAVRERVIEREAAPAVERRTKETTVKKGDGDNDNDVDVNVDVDKD